MGGRINGLCLNEVIMSLPRSIKYGSYGGVEVVFKKVYDTFLSSLIDSNGSLR